MRKLASLVPCIVMAVAAGGDAASSLRQPPSGTNAAFDAKSFLVGGERVFLLAGAVHYFRIPPDEWRDRLLQTRLAGFNAIETPVPWNLHQPSKDELSFEGIADLPRFLDLCHELKLLAIVRIGPYVNAAVTSGGLPHWLGQDPKLLIRSSNPRFIEATRAYWAKLLPAVLDRQVPRGPVAMLQIEDHYQGTDERYLVQLYDDVKNRGARVPVVLSELNPCKDFQRLHDADKTFTATTELMVAGPLRWGERRARFAGMGDIILEGIAKGIDGYNHAMWAAGTNFALLPASSFPTRYEDATCGLLEGGGLSPIFAEAKAVNWLVRAFESVLAQATTLQEHPLLDQARRAGLVAYGRSDGQAAIVFVKRRYGQGPLALKDAATGEEAALPTDATHFRHVVTGFPLTPKTTLAFSTAQVFAARPFADKRVIVVYAPLDSEAVMVFRAAKEPAVRAGADGLGWNEKQKQLVLRWPCAAKGARKDFVFDADVPIHVIALEESQVAYTWVLEGAGILVGAPQVGEWTTGDKTDIELRVPARRVQTAITFYPDGPQRTLGKLTGATDARYDEAARRIDFALNLDIMEPLNVFLRKWEMADALAEAAPDCDDAAWREVLRPEPMGEDHHGWYRCRFRASKAGTRKLVLENVADSVTVYLNGQYVGQSTTKRLVDGPRSFPHPTDFELSLAAGDNVLAVLAKNWGCYRNASCYGVPYTTASGWGILGDALVGGQPPGRWRQREGLAPSGRALAWGPLKTQQSPIRWYRTAFTVRKHPARLAARASLKGLSHGAMWLNGHFAGLYSQSGADAGLGYRLPTPWLKDQNELIVLEEGGKQPEGTETEVRFDRNETYVPLRLEFAP